MGNESKYKILFFIFLIALIIGWLKFNNLKEENSILTDAVDAYQDALDHANQNIEEANSTIEDAQSYAWDSYEEMGNALDNLTTVDTVFDPAHRSLFKFPKLPEFPKLPKFPKLPNL